KPSTCAACTATVNCEARPATFLTSACAGLPLLVLFLPLALEVELPLLPPNVDLSLPLELVPLDLQRVLDGELHVVHLPLGGERHLPALELHVLELRLLLVLVGHHPGKLAAILLDDQGGLPLLPTDLVLA